MFFRRKRKPALEAVQHAEPEALKRTREQLDDILKATDRRVDAVLERLRERDPEAAK